MSHIHHPHDHFVKASLKQKVIAIDFLKAHLPEPLYQRLDTQSLQLIDKIYVNVELKEMHSDVVFHCQIEGKSSYIPILFLIEHQSKAHKQMAFRLLQYTLHLMDDHLKAGNTTLPLVLPVCLYHGTTAPYPYSTDIYDSFEDKGLAKSLVFQPFQLIDLTQLSIDTLQKNGTAAIMEILLKISQTRKTIAHLRALKNQGFFTLITKQVQDPYFITVLNYLVKCIDNDSHESVDELLTLLTTTLPEKQETIMTFAQQLEQRGLEKGIQQGVQKGIQAGIYQEKLKNAKLMLNEGMSPSTIQRITGLSHDVLVGLNNN